MINTQDNEGRGNEREIQKQTNRRKLNKGKKLNTTTVPLWGTDT